MLPKIILQLFSIAFFVGPMIGQGYNCERLSVENLLPSNEVYITIADQAGYIWMGTEAGLFRYDGRDLEKIMFHSGPTYQSVYEIHEDNHGRLWIYASDGKVRFLDQGKFVEIEDKTSRLSSFKMGFYQSKQGSVWIGSNREGYYSYDANQGLKQFHYDIGCISEIYHVSPNVLIMVGADGIFKHIADQERAEKIVEYQQPGIPRSVRHGDTLVVFYNNLVSKISLSELKEISRSTLAFQENIIHASEDTEGNIVVGTRNSLYSYDGARMIEHELSESLRGHSISYYSQDRAGNIWISTLDEGIFRFYKPIINKVKNTEITPVRNIGEDRDELVIGANKGKYVTMSGDVLSQEQVVDNWLFEGEVKSIINDPPYRWTLTDNTMQLVEGEKEFSSFFGSRNMAYDYENQVIHAVSIAGAFQFTPEEFIKLTETGYERYIHHPEQSRSIIYTSDIKDLEFIPGGNTWYVGKEGLANGADDFDYWKDKHALLNQEFEGIASNAKDKLYLLTRDEEVLCFDLTQDSVYSILSDQSNCGDMIREIKYDYHNDLLWIAYNSAIARVDVNRSLDNIDCFGFSDGLPFAIVNDMYPKDSSLLIGTENGLYILNHKNSESLSNKIRIDINGLSNRDNTRKSERGYIIYDAENSLLFDALALGVGPGLHYKYKINDEEWKPTEDERVPLDRLDYGENSILIQAQSADGKASPTEEVKISYIRPWYFNPLFWVLGLLAIALLFYSGIISININIIKHKMLTWISQFQKPPLKLTIKTTSGIFVNLLIQDILYVSAAGNYIEIFSKEEKYTSRMTFSSFLNELKEDTSLHQIHRSYIANLDKISQVKPKSVILDDIEIPYSTKYKKVILPLKKRLHLNSNGDKNIENKKNE